MTELEPQVIDAAMAKAALPTRSPGAHKWGVGGVVIVAGSPSYPGAAILASRAAGRAGAGIVLLATSRRVVGSIAAAIPEVAFVPLPEMESSSGARHAADVIEEKLERAKAVVIGPGLGADEVAHRLLAILFGFDTHGHGAKLPMGFGAGRGEAESPTTPQSALFDSGIGVVVDADALGWLAEQPTWWERIPAHRLILTPHPGEMSRLIGRPVADIIADPAALAREAARVWRQTVVLKGERTVVSDGDRVLIAETACPALATAGSGDVLAGTLGALLAQTGDPLAAACIAVYAGPCAANARAAEFGVQGVIATDLPDAIASELARLGRVDELDLERREM